ncbi:hypothetical protein LTR04_004604 [Oleoguttula sp. CCFEE 6159]|nr:hypothetical protein LTR04_004604 [Oleoguttula sp. CCFEE 6159]
MEYRFDTQATFDGTPTEKKLIANESSENKPSTDNTKDQERSEASNGIHAQPIPEDFIKASAASVSVGAEQDGLDKHTDDDDDDAADWSVVDEEDGEWDALAEAAAATSDVEATPLPDKASDMAGGDVVNENEKKVDWEMLENATN